ncbi:hypothetical protein Mgra_00007896 [Meloidogyne graminicola]|uniref:Uncharacterized protein n=1 Tax=Meloidogyne graminicola TaxID=189291 RepID=A0A8S9ZH94_9BILA|nr:hypothetical protein Mgra_00007896 [Meloidogyne graminicola]
MLNNRQLLILHPILNYALYNKHFVLFYCKHKVEVYLNIKSQFYLKISKECGIEKKIKFNI